MKNLVGLLLFSLLIIVGCQTQGEQCDENGEIFNTLVENRDIWLNRLQHENGFTLETTENETYVIRRAISDSNDILVITQEEFTLFPDTNLGAAGYYYSPTGDNVPGLPNDYSQQYMGNDIWCYKRR